jgi:hypothetical protein
MRDGEDGLAAGRQHDLHHAKGQDDQQDEYQEDECKANAYKVA